MTTSTRYYITTDDNSTSIIDGATGRIVDSEPNWGAYGESFEIRDGRLQCQRQRCANLNRDDYATQRQFGESRAAFAARVKSNA